MDAFNRPRGERKKSLGVGFASDDGSKNRPSTHAEDVADKTGELDVGVFERLLDSLSLAGSFSNELLASPGQLPQLLNAVPEERSWTE